MYEAIVHWTLLLEALAGGLASELGHRDFEQRERASQNLATLGLLALPQLELATHHPDLEVARRAAGLNDSIQRQHAEHLAALIMPTDYPYLPWIDMLPHDLAGRHTIVHRYMEMVRVPAKESLAEWPEYRRATFFYVRDQLLEGKSRQEVIDILDRMVESERQWYRYGGYRWARSAER